MSEQSPDSYSLLGLDAYTLAGSRSKSSPSLLGLRSGPPAYELIPRDIRTAKDYSEFYERYEGKGLPPPLEPFAMDESTVDEFRSSGLTGSAPQPFRPPPLLKDGSHASFGSSVAGLVSSASEVDFGSPLLSALPAGFDTSFLESSPVATTGPSPARPPPMHLSLAVAAPAPLVFSMSSAGRPPAAASVPFVPATVAAAAAAAGPPAFPRGIIAIPVAPLPHSQSAPSSPSGGSTPVPVPMRSTSGSSQGTDAAIARRRPPIDFATDGLIVVRGYMTELSREQQGCRFLQRHVDEGGEAAVAMMLDELLPVFHVLMADAFGNYLAQRLYEAAGPELRVHILGAIAPALAGVTQTVHGTRAVQRVIELAVTRGEQELVVLALAPSVLTLICDVHGNHAIQRLLQSFAPPFRQFAVDAMLASCAPLCCDRYGCCVVQRAIDHCDGVQRAAILSEVIRIAVSVVSDSFGNYVCGHVVELESPELTDALALQLSVAVVPLSLQKYSSNVIEKVLKKSTPPVRDMLVHAIAAAQQLPMLLGDAFGNYVVQTALAVSKGEPHQALVAAISAHMQVLKASPYAKRILQRMRKELSKKKKHG